MLQRDFETERELTLPRGYLDADGTLHREVRMRLATAADEILPLKDPRVVRNPAYLVVILLSKVITKLGTLEHINPGVIEGLFAVDLAYLQEQYNRLNSLDGERQSVACPNCGHVFDPEASDPGGSAATPLTSSTGR